MSILGELRANPEKVIKETNIYVDVKLMGSKSGGPIIINEKNKTSYSYFSIISAVNSYDYYFPFVSRNAGDICMMPIEGTIVVTAGMNGCALEVCHSSKGYHFYHDADGKYMSKVHNPGITVCRIEANSYWSNSYIKSYEALQYAQPVICFICVYRYGYWHVGAFGFNFKFNPIEEDIIKDCFEPKGGKYRGYFNDTIHLIQR